MHGIGGNTTVELQIKTDTKNSIGENIHAWKTVQRLKGWLDFMSGEARRTVYNAKIEESTHVFIADYIPLNALVTAENARLVHNGETYDITLVDNPMGLQNGSQWEFYLKYTGGQNG